MNWMPNAQKKHKVQGLGIAWTHPGEWATDLPYTVFDGVYHTPRCRSHLHGAVLQARLLGNQEGAKCRTIRLRKALGEMFPSKSSRRDVSKTPTFLGTDSLPTVGTSSIEHRPRGVWYTPANTVISLSRNVEHARRTPSRGLPSWISTNQPVDFTIWRIVYFLFIYTGIPVYIFPIPFIIFCSSFLSPSYS